MHRRAFGLERVVRLVDALRAAPAALAPVSLVATVDDQVVGHVLFSAGRLDAPTRLVDVLVLSPPSDVAGFGRYALACPIVRTHMWPAIGIAAAVLLASCSSGSHHSSPARTPLRDALGKIAANDNTRAWVEFGRPQALLAANGGSAARVPYGNVSGYGMSDLAGYAKLLPPIVGFDPNAADVAVSAGRPPTHAGWLIGGVDSGQVEQALAKLGAKKDGAMLRLAPDNQLDLGGPLTARLQAPLNMLNVVATSDGSLRYGTSAASLDLVGTSQGTTLGSDDTVMAVAACLGNPLAAVLTDQPSAKSTTRREIGIGVSGTSSTDAAETLCVATGSSDDAAAIKTRLQNEFASGRSERTGSPWSDLLTGVSVEVLAGNIVRATAHPPQGTSASALPNALVNGDLASLIGP